LPKFILSTPKVTKLQEHCLDIDGDVMAFAEFLIDDAFNQLTS
jgi:hypothetical protein